MFRSAGRRRWRAISDLASVASVNCDQVVGTVAEVQVAGLGDVLSGLLTYFADRLCPRLSEPQSVSRPASSPDHRTTPASWLT